ncbi:MAG: DUF1016 N-terminal domain-containing protein [Prevotellaceae bacterium]|jgi:hypothetical protein|nr:DUF1016 N-terminal domain-containing protein [Prevotellaceae bacterium]
MNENNTISTNSNNLLRKFCSRRDAVRHELGWTHYRKIMKVENEHARIFYIDECVKSKFKQDE